MGNPFGTLGHKTHKLPIVRKEGDVWEADVRRAIRDVSERVDDMAGQIQSIKDVSKGVLRNGGETAVSATAVLVLAANPDRKVAILQNVGAANVRVGVDGVTATTGFRLVSGASFLFSPPYVPTQALYAIRETADSTVFTQEVV